MSVPQNLIYARDHYLAKGIPLGGSIALSSVLYYESKLNPGSQGYQSTETPGVMNPHGAYGIASWNGPRQQDLLTFATKHNLPADELNTQLDFVLTEIANGYTKSWAAIRSSATYKSVIPIIVDEYENPKDKTAEIDGALVIAAALASAPVQPAPPVPEPQPVPPAPVPQAPAPQAPPPVFPVPTVPAGLPPVTSTSAARIAALTDTILAARADRVSELVEGDPEIAGYDASLIALGKIIPVIIPIPIPAALPNPADPAVPPPQRSPSMFGLSINWKTSLSGVLAAAFQGVAVAYPQYAPIFQVFSSVAMAALGLTAKDSTTTGGTVAATPEAAVRIANQ